MQKLLYVKKLERAIQNITTCTGPTVQVEDVEAVADRLYSPYASRRLVEYRPAFDNVLMRARNARNDIVICGNYGLPQAHTVTTIGGPVVGRWERLAVPTSAVRPLFGLAERLGLTPPKIEWPLVEVHLLVPEMAGFNGRRPVFVAAADCDTNTTASLSLSHVRACEQGSLTLIEAEDASLSTYWNSEEWFFNHRLANGVCTVTTGSTYDACAVVVAHEGRLTPALRLVSCGGVKITSPDHSEITIPVGDWVAIHPFPADGVD